MTAHLMLTYEKEKRHKAEEKRQMLEVRVALFYPRLLLDASSYENVGTKSA